MLSGALSARKLTSAKVQNTFSFQAVLRAPSTGNTNKNSSGDEIANVNFYAVRPEATRIRRNNAK